MKKQIAIVTVFAMLAFAATSCKKCLTCSQYCAYCEHPDGNGAIKVCAIKGGGKNWVDSIQQSLKDSTYNCALYNDVQDVCDNKNRVDDASAYFEKQNYYCVEKL